MGIESSRGPDSSRGPRAVARLARQVELALGDVDLSLSQYRVLLHLDDVGPAAASALANRLDVTRPSVTALIDGLAARGLVERLPQPADRRRVQLVVTPAGAAALAAADAAVAARLDHIAENLTEHGDADRAVAALDSWADALDAMRRAWLDGT